MAKRDAEADRAVVRALINTPAMHPEILEAMREIGLRVLKRVGQRRRRSLRLRPLRRWTSGRGTEGTPAA